MIINRNLFAFGYLFCFYLRFVILMCLTLLARIIIKKKKRKKGKNILQKPITFIKIKLFRYYFLHIY